MLNGTNIRRVFSQTFRTILSPVTVFCWIISIAVATIAAPFGTFEIMGWPGRMAYWLVIVTFSIVLGYFVRAVAATLISEHRPVLFDLVAICLMTAIFSPVAWVFAQFSLQNTAVQLPSLPVFAAYVSLMAAAIFIGRRLLPGFEEEPYGFMADAKQDPDQPRMLRRLPAEVRGPILRISAKDHTVEIVTCKGTKTLRMRLSDAIAEMEPVKGCCIHRSHWVANSAIIRIERENSHKVSVVLRNGDRLPVSRKYRPNLERTDWL